MKLFYTVDRLATLSRGQVLELVKFTDLQPLELQAHVDLMFPAGVSRHGDNYFLKNSSQASVASPAIELLFEYVRCAHFPDTPSRFESWFAFESITDAETFRARYGNGTGTIWRAGSDRFFRADMRLLTLARTTLVCSWFAHMYWRGEPGPGDPMWEFLLVPPVHVLEPIA